MASGLAVVTTTRCGVAELITEGESGFVRDALDIDGLAAALERLQGPERLRRMGANAASAGGRPHARSPWRASTSRSTSASFTDNGGMSAPSPTSRELYLRLLRNVWPYRAMLAGGGIVAAMIVGGLADAALVKLLDPLVRELFVKHDPALAILLPLAIVAVFVVSGLASFASGYSTQWVSQKVILDLRRAMFGKVLRLPPGYFDEIATASLVTKFTNDVGNLASASTSVLTSLVRDTVTIVALLAILLWSNWRLTLITFVVIPPIALVVRAFSRRLRTMSRETQKAMGGIAEVLDESIANQRVVRVFGGQAYESDRFEKASQRIRRFNMKQRSPRRAPCP